MLRGDGARRGASGIANQDHRYRRWAREEAAFAGYQAAHGIVWGSGNREEQAGVTSQCSQYGAPIDGAQALGPPDDAPKQGPVLGKLIVQAQGVGGQQQQIGLEAVAGPGRVFKYGSGQVGADAQGDQPPARTLGSEIGRAHV